MTDCTAKGTAAAADREAFLAASHVLPDVVFSVLPGDVRTLLYACGRRVVLDDLPGEVLNWLGDSDSDSVIAQCLIALRRGSWQPARAATLPAVVLDALPDVVRSRLAAAALDAALCLLPASDCAAVLDARVADVLNAARDTLPAATFSAVDALADVLDVLTLVQGPVGCLGMIEAWHNMFESLAALADSLDGAWREQVAVAAALPAQLPATDALADVWEALTNVLPPYVVDVGDVLLDLRAELVDQIRLALTEALPVANLPADVRAARHEALGALSALAVNFRDLTA